MSATDLSSLLARQARDRPDAPAVVFRGRTVTYEQVDDAVGRAAAAFVAAGIGPGDRVALMVGNVPEFVYALYGAWRAGAVAVPLNVMLTSEEVGYMLADSGTKAVVTQIGFLPTILAVRDRLSDLQRVFVVAGPPVPSGTASFEQSMGAHRPIRDTTDSPDDLALIQYTSGTTADPKGAMLGHDNLVANLDQMDEVPLLRIAQDDVVLVVLPLFHIYALNVILGMTIRSGATAVLVERFEPDETLELVERHGVTLLPGAPPMYVAWLEEPEERRGAFSTVRMAISGAAPLSAELLQRFRQRFGVTIWDSYGLTEAGPAVTSSAAGPEARPGSIGLPIPGVEVRLVEEHDEGLGDVEEGDPGEILVRGPNVFRGYWRKDDATAETMHEGWLRTGDVAYRDEDGYLFLVDRTKDLVIVSGFNVFPKEVEEALARLPQVAEAAVIGIPDERTGEAVKAYVVLQEGAAATAEELVDGVSRYLARFKVPKELEIVSEIPRHATGKVLRRALRGEESLRGTEPGASGLRRGDRPVG